jgi:hypothetical protein
MNSVNFSETHYPFHRPENHDTELKIKLNELRFDPQGTLAVTVHQI